MAKKPSYPAGQQLFLAEPFCFIIRNR